MKSFYIDPSWISSVKLIIPAACNASKEMVGAFPCLCAAIVSQHVMQNDQGKDPIADGIPAAFWLLSLQEIPVSIFIYIFIYIYIPLA